MNNFLKIFLLILWTGAVSIITTQVILKEIKNSTQTTTSNTSLGTTTSSSAASSTNEVVVEQATTPPTDGTAIPGAAYKTVKKQVTKAQYMNAALVANHKTKSDCWIIVEGSVYNVTEYIAYHPGGEQTIVSNCGSEATNAFNTKGGSGRSHSDMAKSLLKKYLVAKIGDTYGNVTTTETVKVPISTGVAKFTVGSDIKTTSDVRVRSTPSTSGTLLATETSGATGKIIAGPTTANNYIWYQISYSNGIKGWSIQDSLISNTLSSTVTPTTPIATTPTPGTPTCTSFKYSTWGTCQSDSTKIRTITSSTPSGCTGGTPILSQSCTYTAPVVTNGLTTATVATHNSLSSCWLIISGKIYDVTQYIPFHPGGQNAILSYCGKEATTAFETKGGGGSHSINAHTLLANYLVGTLGAATTPTTPTTPTSPTTPTACTTFTYSSWGACQSNNTQSRTVNTSSPSGCTGGSPVTTQSCTYTPPVTPPTSSGGVTAATVATHSSTGNCWIIVSNNVYNVTQYIPFHPGGQNQITQYCGKDATTGFNTRGGTGSHSANAKNLLANYLVGPLTTVTPPATGGGATTCSSFTYNAWGSCQIDNTQTRTVNTSSPSGCTGGSPILSQSCTYVAGGATCTSFTYSSWGACQINNTQSRTVRTSSPSGCTGGSPVTTQSCTYVDPSATHTYNVSVDSSGNFSQTSITLAVGDSITFTYSNPGNENIVQFSPSSVASYTRKANLHSYLFKRRHLDR
jgi:cytochrome b involved in lipid metabolism